MTDPDDDEPEQKPVGPRRRARELALGYLYALDIQKKDGMEDFDDYVVHLRVRGPALEFAHRLVQGVLRHRNELDALLEGVARNWRLGRMAALDRNVLRLAAYEMAHEDDIPATVTINEAVELAKQFSTAQSGAFVNGILDKLKHRVASS